MALSQSHPCSSPADPVAQRSPDLGALSEGEGSGVGTRSPAHLQSSANRLGTPPLAVLSAPLPPVLRAEWKDRGGRDPLAPGLGAAGHGPLSALRTWGAHACGGQSQGRGYSGVAWRGEPGAASP